MRLWRATNKGNILLQGHLNTRSGMPLKVLGGSSNRLKPVSVNLICATHHVAVFRIRPVVAVV